MTRVRVDSFTVSLDGYGAGPSQDIISPLGVGGTELHQWLFPTRTLQRNLLVSIVAQRELTTTSLHGALKTSAHGFSDEICSRRFVALGPT